ncbi:MAG: ABC transporter ATP-binding protein [Ruminococcaceae bacterium]|nr:ABC transporter ATP-binding protein [Oscillospiraceae bacterium]
MVSSNKKRDNNKSSLLWIYRTCKRHIPAVVTISFVSAAISVLAVALAMISKNVLEIATNDREGSLLHYGILLVSVIVIQIVLHIADTLIKCYTDIKINISIRNKLFTAISRRKYSEISEYHSGDLLNRLTSDVDVVTGAVVNILPNIASMGAKIIGGMAALIVLDKRIALLVLVFGIAVPALGRTLSKRFKKLHKDVQKAEGKARSFMQECFENIVVLKAFEGEAPFTRKLGQYLNSSYRAKMKRCRVSVVMHMGMYTFFTLGYYAVLLWGATQIHSGAAFTFGMLTAFLQLFQQLRAPLQNVSAILPQYYSALASAERLMEIENGTMDKATKNETLTEIKKNFCGIELNNITFAYKDEIILKNLNLSVEKAKITAVTGESGSGKSTIFKLLLGLYEAQSGSITVNGSIPLDTSLRGIFAYVPQGNMILSGTVRENLTICNDNVSEEEIIKATKAAEIYDIISALPDGFETELSERGGGLSEGQLQRISIARALLTDAPVLLLDEATSALDEATETKVLNNIKEMEGKTILFVTHRNTSLKVCDKILHIEKEI